MRCEPGAVPPWVGLMAGMLWRASRILALALVDTQFS